MLQPAAGQAIGVPMNKPTDPTTRSEVLALRTLAQERRRASLAAFRRRLQPTSPRAADEPGAADD